MQQRVYEKHVNDFDELCQRLLSVWHSIGQKVIDEAIDQWRARLDSPPVYEQKAVILSTWCKKRLELSVSVTWYFASVLNWIWRCCISTHLTFQVSQGSAATDLRWGENFNKFLFRNSLLNIVVKKLRKSVNICQSYLKNKSVSFLWTTVYIALTMLTKSENTRRNIATFVWSASRCRCLVGICWIGCHREISSSSVKRRKSSSTVSSNICIFCGVPNTKYSRDY